MYVLADSSGELCEFATSRVLGQFHAWSDDQTGEVTKFSEQGYTEHPELLAKELEGLNASEEVEELRQLLLLHARGARDVLIVSTGTHEELRSLSTKDNTPLHRAVDRLHRKMLLAASYAFGVGRKAVQKDALAGATTEAEALVALDQAPKAVHDAVLKVFPPLLLQIMKVGGNVELKKLKKLRNLAPAVKGQPHSTIEPFDLAFDVESKEAIAWAKEHAGKLAVGISDTTREDIAEAVAAALEGEGIESAYDDILAAVGDESRAEMIARTEIMDAANEGLAQSWEQAVEAGLLTGREKKVWISTSNCCDECEELDGEEVPLNEDFSAGDDPPLHPNCRCTMGLSGE